MLHPLLDINLINFNDPYEIGGFVSLLCQIGSNMGMALSDFKPTRESNELRQIANKLVRKLDEILLKMSAANALLIVSAYDIAHRFAYKSPADPKTQNKYILKAFDALIHGDKEVDEYNLYQLIENKILFKDQAYFDKPLQWISISIDRWCDNFIYGKSQVSLSDYDTIQQVTILLRSNLFFKFGNDAEKFKKELFDNHNYFLNKYVSTDARILLAIHQLSLIACRYFDSYDSLSFNKELYSERNLKNFRVNKFYIEAFRISQS